MAKLCCLKSLGSFYSNSNSIMIELFLRGEIVKPEIILNDKTAFLRDWWCQTDITGSLRQTWDKCLDL
jgi:hypothetical protein